MQSSCNSDPFYEYQILVVLCNVCVVFSFNNFFIIHFRNSQPSYASTTSQKTDISVGNKYNGWYEYKNLVTFILHLVVLVVLCPLLYSYVIALLVVKTLFKLKLKHNKFSSVTKMLSDALILLT